MEVNKVSASVAAKLPYYNYKRKAFSVSFIKNLLVQQIKTKIKNNVDSSLELRQRADALARPAAPLPV